MIGFLRQIKVGGGGRDSEFRSGLESRCIFFFFFNATTVWFSSKMSKTADSLLCMFTFSLFSQRRLLMKSAALTFGWPWHPADSTCFVCSSFIVRASPSYPHPLSLPLLSDFFSSLPSLLSPALISCCQRNSKYFRSCAHQSQMCLAKNVAVVSLALRLDSAVPKGLIAWLLLYKLKLSPAGLGVNLHVLCFCFSLLWGALSYSL